MIEQHLQREIDRIGRRIGRQRLVWCLALCWMAGTLCAAAVSWAMRDARVAGAAEAAAGVLVVTLALVMWIAARVRRGADRQAAARAIERVFPDLNARLLAAAEQRPDPATGRLTYLQRDVVYDVLEHGRRHDWRRVVPTRRVVAAFAVQSVCFAAFLAVTIGLVQRDLAATTAARPTNDIRPAAFDEYGLSVEPGHAEIERGTSLLVLARFERKLPGTVRVVVHQANHAPRTILLAKSLDDPLFGGRIPEVPRDLTYCIEYDGRHSPEFTVTVFDYPRLERADLMVIAPAYAGRDPVSVPDARRVSVLEGSEVVLVCHASKPLAAARLSAGDASFDMQPAGGSETAWTVTLQPLASTRYQLHLTDGDGRSNKLPAEFLVDVIPNRPPELKLTFPGRDVRVSPLEELTLEATAWDDVGLVRYGLVYAHDGRETTIILGESTPAAPRTADAQDVALAHQLALEELGAEPDELLSYYFFADDHGPDGAIRRTASDMYFAEVRPFEEIFREGQQPPRGGGAPSGGPQGQEIEQLAELQKQIVSATWTVIRRESLGAAGETTPKDIEAIAESQQAAIEQLGELREKLTDARSQRFADDAEDHMQEALERLRDPHRTGSQPVRPGAGSKTPPPPGRSGTPSYGEGVEAVALTAALSAEQAAYQAVLRLRAREHQVVRGQGGGGGGGGGSPSQQQLDQLELTSKQNRYQTEQRAQAEPPSIGREQLQVLNRLRELARRQSGVNQQLKELELALQTARTDEERQELERRLKRLREEQQQVLRDLDEVRDRMDRPENQQQMSDARRQVEESRRQVREASEALRDGQVSQAINSGTRAERSLEELREDFRRRTAHEFADAMNDLRERARDLSERQEQLGQSLTDLETKARRSLRDAEQRHEISRELKGQQDRLSDVLERMRQVIEQAESSEPLLSKQLYDAVRQARADAPEKSLESAANLTERGLLSDARSASDQARRGIDGLRDGVEQAADAVLGNELDALKRAREDLEDLAQDLDREVAQAGGSRTGTPGDRPEQTADASQAGPRSDTAGQGEPPAGQEQRADRAGTTGPDAAQSGRSFDSEGRPAGGSTQDQQGSSRDQQPSPRDQQNSSRQPGASQAQQSSAQHQWSAESAPSPGGQSGQSASQSEGQSEGQSGGQSAGDSNSPSDSPAGDSGSRGPGRQQQPSLSNGGQSGGPGEGPGSRAGPLTGEEFQHWSDRMRDVEETVGDPDLRNEVSRIRERARSIRAEFKRHAREPNWDLVRTDILEPMLELEDRLAEEIARRESSDTLVPIDRDPVPTRFAEAVREYYERLGESQRR